MQLSTGEVRLRPRDSDGVHYSEQPHSFLGLVFDQLSLRKLFSIGCA
jgi:hypothetical protein